MKTPEQTPVPNSDTVEALVETLRDFLATEDAREQSVNTRGGGVVVFGGVILSLLASLGQTVLGKNLSCGWDEATAVLFATAIVALVVAITFTLFFVLIPKQSASIAMDEIEDYGEMRIVSQPRIETQGALLEGLIRLLAIDRERASKKTAWLARAYGALGIALLAVACLGLILGAQESGLL